MCMKMVALFLLKIENLITQFKMIPLSLSLLWNLIKSRNTPKNLKSNPVSDENESDGKASPSLAPIPISTSSSEDEDEIECKDELEKDDYGNKVNDEENDIDDWYFTWNYFFISCMYCKQ